MEKKINENKSIARLKPNEQSNHNIINHKTGKIIKFKNEKKKLYKIKNIENCLKILFSQKEFNKCFKIRLKEIRDIILDESLNSDPENNEDKKNKVSNSLLTKKMLNEFKDIVVKTCCQTNYPRMIPKAFISCILIGKGFKIPRKFLNKVFLDALGDLKPKFENIKKTKRNPMSQHQFFNKLRKYGWRNWQVIENRLLPNFCKRFCLLDPILKNNAKKIKILKENISSLLENENFLDAGLLILSFDLFKYYDIEKIKDQMKTAKNLKELEILKNKGFFN